MSESTRRPNPELLVQHAGFVRALARGLLFDDHQAEDAVQEAWLAALQNPPGTSNLRGWLARVVRNRALLRRRREGRIRRRERVAARPEPQPSPVDTLERLELERAITDALEALREPHRAAVMARYYDGLKPREIAARLGVPTATVKTRLQRGLRELRGVLDQRFPSRRNSCLALLSLAVPNRAAPAMAGAVGAAVMTKKTLLIASTLLCVLVAGLLWKAAGSEGPDQPRAARTDGTPVGDAGSLTGPSGDRGPNVPVAGSAGEDPAPPPDLPPLLRKAGVLEGRVQHKGRPVSGAFVYVAAGMGLQEQATTGADGSFSFARTGKLRVGAVHPDHGPVRRAVDVPADGATVVLELPDSVQLDVLVLDDRTGRPVENAQVQILSGKSESFPGGRNRGLLESFRKVRSVEDLDLRMLAALEVRDMATMFSAMPALWVEAGRTDASGRVRFRGLVDGTADLVVHHPRYVATRVGDARTGSEVTVRLGRGGGLTVIAPLVEGRKASGWVCELRTPGVMAWPAARVRTGADGRAEFLHLPPGRFQLIASPRGTWTLSVRANPAGGPGATHSLSVGIRDGGPGTVKREVRIREDEHVVVDLRRYQPGGTIEGVFRPGAKDREGPAIVLLEPMEGPGGTQVQTDDGGAFRFENVQVGRYRLLGLSRKTMRRAQATVDIADPSDRVSVELRVGRAAIDGTLLGDDRTPVAGATIYLESDGKSVQAPRTLAQTILALPRSVPSDAAGRFRFEGLAAGRYRLVCAEGNRVWVRPLDLHEGARERVTFRLRKAQLRKLTVRLRDPEGRSVAGTLGIQHVEGGRAEGMALEAESALPAGGTAASFELFVPVGDYFLSARVEGLAPVLKKRVAVRDAHPVALVLPRGVPVTLRLLEDGQPAAREILSVVNERGVPLDRSLLPLNLEEIESVLRTDAEGRLLLPHVGPGRYVVRHRGVQIGTVDVERSPVVRTFRIRSRPTADRDGR